MFCMLAHSNHCIFFFSVPALQADPNTLFRSNSLSSKAMEQFMKVSKIISFAETDFAVLVEFESVTAHAEMMHYYTFFPPSFRLLACCICTRC